MFTVFFMKIKSFSNTKIIYAICFIYFLFKIQEKFAAALAIVPHTPELWKCTTKKKMSLSRGPLLEKFALQALQFLS